MLYRFCRCGGETLSRITYGGEERLIVLYRDIIYLRKSVYPLPFRFFADYSEANGALVFLYATVVLDRTLSCVFIFKKGRLDCVVESVEEGAKRRKVYGKAGVCVGDDYKSPFAGELLLGGAEIIISMADRPVEKTDYGVFLSYKHLFGVPAIFAFCDGFFVIDKTIRCIDENKTTEIKHGVALSKLKNGYGKVLVIE